MNEPTAHCEELIQTTADALNSGAVTLMLLAVQTKNLELSVQYAVQKSLEVLNVVRVVEMCFPAVVRISHVETSSIDDSSEIWFIWQACWIRSVVVVLPY
jgi:hypothetical protein